MFKRIGIFIGGQVRRLAFGVLAFGKTAQEIAQKLIAAFAVVFVVRRAHHGGDFRHRHAEFLLSQDRQNIVGLQRESDTQFFQYDIVKANRLT
jgi:hypothetical protein